MDPLPRGHGYPVSLADHIEELYYNIPWGISKLISSRIGIELSVSHVKAASVT